jgi:hypothetical protein
LGPPDHQARKQEAPGPQPCQSRRAAALTFSNLPQNTRKSSTSDDASVGGTVPIRRQSCAPDLSSEVQNTSIEQISPGATVSRIPGENAELEIQTSASAIGNDAAEFPRTTDVRGRPWHACRGVASVLPLRTIDDSLATGQVITIYNDDQLLHHIVADDGSFDSGVLLPAQALRLKPVQREASLLITAPCISG